MKRISSLLLISFLSISLFAQSVSPELIATAGDYNQNASVSISWSIGEISISTYTNGIILSEGFHSVVDSENIDIDEIETYFEINIFPNPTQDILFIEKLNNNIHLSVEIFDSNGRKVIKKFLFDDKTSFSMSQYASGIYIIVINDNLSNQSQTYKLIKQ